MNIASIDIGSNTVLLLIASIQNNKMLPLINQYRSPRLGKGLTLGGNILEERIQSLMEILSDYKSLIHKYNCSKTIITATNAMRIASNSDEIINRIRNKLGMEIRIIQGDEEAKLSFMGASSSLSNNNNRVVIDIGGGSTEVIYGNNDEIYFKNSFQTGVVSLTEMFLKEFPYPNFSLIKANEHLKDVFRSIETNKPQGLTTIAVAGTPTTLSCIKQHLKIYDEAKVEGSILDQNDLNKLYNSLSVLSGNEIKERFGDVVSGREDVLFSGLLILNQIMSIGGIPRIIVSSRGLRYGNIINYMDQLK